MIEEKVWFICQDVRIGELSETEATHRILQLFEEEKAEIFGALEEHHTGYGNMIVLFDKDLEALKSRFLKKEG